MASNAPQEFSSSSAESKGDTAAHRQLLRTTWPMFPDVDHPRMNGLNVLISLIRHITTFTPGKDLCDIGQETHRIHQVARKIVTETNWGAIKSMKEGAMEELCPGWKTSSDANLTSFFQLVNTKDVVETFWIRDHLRLFDSVILRKDPNQDGWTEHTRMSAKQASKKNVIKYDGDGDLGQSVGRPFVPRRTATGEWYLWETNKPLAIRVHFTPAEGVNQKGFMELRQFSFPARVRHTGNIASIKHRKQDLEMMHYRLSAAIRLRSQPEEDDFIRLYDAQVENLAPPVAAEPILEDTWKIGQPGHSYMLLYRRIAEADASTETFTDAFPAFALTVPIVQQARVFSVRTATIDIGTRLHTTMEVENTRRTTMITANHTGPTTVTNLAPKGTIPATTGTTTLAQETGMNPVRFVNVVATNLDDRTIDLDMKTNPRQC
ncbi:hypothetical protein F4780DRAFT_779151 [Xylariomycetidae sp. FL0641]|nr:hypothetical protein F4780DRAFT_779151 [Xylariomycetidae sp. FL0641]